MYLNRTCWNGLYRVNRKGQFNVPKGTKSTVIFPHDDFQAVSDALQSAELSACDFEETIAQCQAGDLLFVDPPYTVKHNFNGFVKYNETIFSWDDQIRLRDAVADAAERGVRVVLANAAHATIEELYEGIGTTHKLSRESVISGKASARGVYEELLVVV